MCERCFFENFAAESSSSSCRAASMDIPDPLSPLLPIVHRFWQVFRATSLILTQLLYVGSSWSSCFCLAVCRGPQEYITYELVLASPAVSCISGSSNLDSFCDGRQVAVQLVLCGVLPPGLVQYCLQHSCVIAVQLLLQPFCQHPSSASIQQYRHDHAWKKLHFILSVRSDFHMIDSLLIAVHAFVSCVSMSFSVDEILLSRYVNLSTSFSMINLVREIKLISNQLYSTYKLTLCHILL